jgi:ubiquinone/menaquinone biosynthesis C-methylase UbiE
MTNIELKRIKTKIQSIDPQRWWGDDFDVRFYLISRLKEFKDLEILDVGGGIGITSSEIDSSNRRINLDMNVKDLSLCLQKNDKDIHNVCGTSDCLPFRDMVFDIVVCAHLIELLKEHDLKKNSGSLDIPSIRKLMDEIFRVLKKNGKLFLTTPNNAYYKTTKISIDELRNAIFPHFPNAKIFFYNTYPRLSRKKRKLNMANVIPKISAKFINSNKVLKNLLKKHSINSYSVSFFVEATRNN